MLILKSQVYVVILLTIMARHLKKITPYDCYCVFIRWLHLNILGVLRLYRLANRNTNIMHSGNTYLQIESRQLLVCNHPNQDYSTKSQY